MKEEDGMTHHWAGTKDDVSVSTCSKLRKMKEEDVMTHQWAGTKDDISVSTCSILK